MLFDRTGGRLVFAILSHRVVSTRGFVCLLTQFLVLCVLLVCVAWFHRGVVPSYTQIGEGAAWAYIYDGIRVWASVHARVCSRNRAGVLSRLRVHVHVGARGAGSRMWLLLGSQVSGFVCGSGFVVRLCEWCFVAADSSRVRATLEKGVLVFLFVVCLLIPSFFGFWQTHCLWLYSSA